jgi:hypothetical protein
MTRVLRCGKKAWSRHFRGQYGTARGPEQRRHGRSVEETLPLPRSALTRPIACHGSPLPIL